MDLQLRGTIALISGASAGIGRVTAQTLGREGVQVVVVARREAELRALAQEMVEEGSPEPFVLVDDLGDDGSFDRIATTVLGELGRVDMVINNLGQARPFDLDTSEEEWDEAFRLNFVTPRRLTGPFLPGMAERRWGRVICLTATSEPTHVSGSLTSKAALLIWAKGLARVVAKDGITVNCISPGYLMTEQIKSVFIPSNFPTDEAKQAWLDREIPMGRFGEASDAANVIAFLCSPLAGYITGQRVYVDGGWNRHV